MAQLVSVKPSLLEVLSSILGDSNDCLGFLPSSQNGALTKQRGKSAHRGLVIDCHVLLLFSLPLCNNRSSYSVIAVCYRDRGLAVFTV